MLPEYQTKTNIGVGLGILLQFAAAFLVQRPGSATAFLALGLAILAVPLFIWGCCMYAIGKGYPGALGLLGLLSCFGLVILVLLPDKHKAARRIA